MKGKITTIFAIAGLFIVIAIFFHRLFYPHISLFVTPDFGQSDLIHAYYPYKYLLFEKLHKFQFPLWTRLEATGYPIFADGQIGALSFVNLFLFTLLPFAFAINFGFILAFFIGGIGTYLFCNEIGIMKIASIFAGIIFALSGFNIGQISHISLLQAASLLPLEFYFLELMIKKGKIMYLLAFSIILSQQIFFGHQQMVAYSLIILLCYFILRSLILNHEYKNNMRSIYVQATKILFGIIGGIILSSALLLPSIELYQVAGGRQGLDVLSQFPYPANNLITFLNPFFFGSPANGTYPLFSSTWGIFWENNGYVGLLPILIIFLSLLFVKKKSILIWLGMVLLSILLVLGKSSPLYFIYNFPPLSMFRVPSRFLLMTDFSLAILTAVTFHFMMKKFHIANSKTMIIGAVLCLIQIINIFSLFSTYHPTMHATKFLSNPDTVNYLHSQKNVGRLFTVEDSDGWNSIFLKKGWKNISSYNKFKSGVIEHSNLLYGLSKSNLLVQFQTKRMNVLSNLIQLEQTGDANNIYKFSTASAHILSLQNSTHIISPNSVEIQGLKVDRKFSDYTIYENTSVVPRARMVYSIKQVKTVSDLQSILSSEDYNPKITAFTDSKISDFSLKSTSTKQKYEINWLSDSDRKIEFFVKTPMKGIFVLSDSYYPGWNAYIDNKRTHIYPVNLYQRGVVLEAGDHNVKFEYEPLSFLYGLAVTLAGYGVISIVLLYKLIQRLISIRFNR